MSVIKNLEVSFDDFLIRAANVELLDSGVTALVGPSGSGKTSFAKALLGLLPIRTGEWIFSVPESRDVDLLQMPVQARRLGVVFQEYGLFPHLSAKENIFFAAKARRIFSAEAEALYERFRSVLSLSNFENTKAAKLSGGESQRTALARALMGKPRFLILDEPFSALDTDNRQSARQLCLSILKELQMPALLITHDQQDVEAMASNILKIQNGVIA